MIITSNCGKLQRVPTPSKLQPEQTSELLVSSGRHVATLTLNRPAQRNALSNELLATLAETLEKLDRDSTIRCIVIAGSDEVFASGADLAELIRTNPHEHYAGPRFRSWDATRRVKTPVVAAVSGFCLGGGMELAMGCDIIVASETARFGLPETALGLVPAAGGTQRLPRIAGRAKALDVILSGRLLDAYEAEACGLAARVVAKDAWRHAAASVAEKIAARAPAAQQLAKEAVNASFEVPLSSGFELERKTFTVALTSDEAKEGIAAFLEKRTPAWGLD
jgi:enoyl-CoA hydratase